MMKRDEIVAGLRRQRVETGSIACLGCGWENSCGTRGCRIMREAADMLENDETHSGVLQDAIEKWKKAYGTLREKHSALLEQNGELRDAAAQVTKLAAEAAVERDWISVDDRLPENSNVVLVTAFWRRRWDVFVGWYLPGCNQWCVRAGVGAENHARVSHWMPMPAPAKEGR